MSDMTPEGGGKVRKAADRGPLPGAALGNAIGDRYAKTVEARRDARAEVLRSFKVDPKLEADCRYLAELNAYDRERLSPQLRRDVQAYKNLKHAAEVFAATGEVPDQFVITFDPNTGDAA